MYAALLAQGNNEFVAGVDRAFPRFRSKRLDAVVAALNAAKANLGARNLVDLAGALRIWQQHEPQEWASRGGTNGVGFRLWMETKQMLRNNFGVNTGLPDPPPPANLPGSLILGVYVPPGEGHVEICHGFAYRWAVAAGKMPLNPALPASFGSPFNAANVTPVLYPLGFAGYPAARANGAMAVQPGDIVGMFTVPPAPQPAALGHSLIAITPTIWFSANNAGTFGVGTDRTQIDTAGAFGVFAGHQVGWVGNGASWRRPDGVDAQVVYRR